MVKTLEDSITDANIDSNTSKIMYGSVVIPNSKPWVVGLTYKNNGKIKCGGVLISKIHVLTAAHCMSRKPKRYVIVGEHDQNNQNDGQRYVRISKYHLHPNYRIQLDISSFDLAMLVLEEEIVLNKKVDIISLPLIHESCENLPVNVTGWGIYEPWGYQHSSSKLRNVEISCLSDSICNVYEYSNAFNPRTMICGGSLKYPRKGSCMGDSGGIIYYLFFRNWNLII